jgi:hypothetical protein
MQPTDNLRARPPLNTTSTGAAFESLRTEFVEAALRDPECKVRTPDSNRDMQTVAFVILDDFAGQDGTAKFNELLRIAFATEAGKHWLEQRAREHARWHAQALTERMAESEDVLGRAFDKAASRRFSGEAVTDFGSLA